MWIAVDRFVAVVLSRLRALAIVSTWILARLANCLDLICTGVNLVKYNENIFCQETFNTALSLK